MPAAKTRKKKWIKRLLPASLIVLITGFLIPENFSMPVKGATHKSYAQNSFWFYPWGKSVTHKGVDIFAKRGTEVHPSTCGIVVFSGKFGRGGNAVMVLGPKWRIHYYAHLDSINKGLFSVVSKKSLIGTVGSSGNAVGKPPHLHYTIKTLVPYVWRTDESVQGWKKMFYLNPIEYLNATAAR